MLTRQEFDKIWAQCETVTPGLDDFRCWRSIKREIARLRELGELCKQFEEATARLREALDTVEPYCREKILTAVDNHYTWIIEACRVCGVEFSHPAIEYKESCPFYKD